MCRVCPKACSRTISMRLLIDGYNLMYARGLMERKLGPERFRRLRTRFLNDLAAALGPFAANETTVVFDASAPPADLPAETMHKGLSIEFAVSDENADARIEFLIARHPTPKTLSVISSDNRIRQAAAHRKAKTITSEDFLDQLDSREHRKSALPAPLPNPEETAREQRLTPAETKFWVDIFGDLARDLAKLEASHGKPTLLTDEEIAEIEREIEREP